MPNKYKILHISSDYPDPINHDKPKAVCTLIDNSRAFDHIIFSLNRFSLPQRSHVANVGNLYPVKYWGLPLGIGLRWFQRAVSKSIAKVIEKDKLDFDIIHAHKLTFEGIVGYYLAQRFNKPLICSIRGTTDIRTLKYKPMYRNFYRKIAAGSRVVFFIAPWAKKKAKERYKLDVDGCEFLPNIISNDSSDGFNPIRHSNRFVTVFRLDWYKVKNIERLIKAFDCVADEMDGIHLDIIGGGSPEATKKIKKMIKSANNAGCIHMTGEMSNSELCKILPDYAALLLPSRTETFGVVYLESIFAGLPFLSSKDTGIDGYFRDADFYASVHWRSVGEMSDAIKDLYQNQLDYKDRLMQFKKNGHMNRFKRESIVSHYTETIKRSLDSNSSG